MHCSYVWRCGLSRHIQQLAYFDRDYTVLYLYCFILSANPHIIITDFLRSLDHFPSDASNCSTFTVLLPFRSKMSRQKASGGRPVHVLSRRLLVFDHSLLLHLLHQLWVEAAQIFRLLTWQSEYILLLAQIECRDIAKAFISKFEAILRRSSRSKLNTTH